MKVVASGQVATLLARMGVLQGGLWSGEGGAGAGLPHGLGKGCSCPPPSVWEVEAGGQTAVHLPCAVHPVLGPEQRGRGVPLLPQPEMTPTPPALGHRGGGAPALPRAQEVEEMPAGVLEFLPLCIYTAVYTHVHFYSIGNVCIESL